MYERKDRVPNFNQHPYIEVQGVDACAGYEAIVEVLTKRIENEHPHVVVLDYYHGVNETLLLQKLVQRLPAEIYVDTNEIKHPEPVIQKKFGRYITDDRVNGVMSVCRMEEFFDEERVRQARERIADAKGLVVVYGVAAAVVHPGDLLVYCNIEVEEVKRRYRRGMDNWGAGNFAEEYLRKEKRYTFLEARVQEAHKRPLLETMDYMIDCHDDDHPVMVSREGFDRITAAFVNRPFMCIPFFQPGIWGGHWIQDVLGAGNDLPNTAWGMTGVLDFQAVEAACGDHRFRFPARDLLLRRPLELLGGQVFYWFGYKMPLTMDFLDTWGGGNLSLQCHPTVAYNQETFNAPFGHYESYYMLDTTEESTVYLGTKEGVKKEDLVAALEEAQKTGEFDDTKWINRFPMHRHDHVFIPSGTIHCSGKNTLVLEININWVSTFKLWDWGRVDFDGKPRPIDIGHGAKNIQERYQTSFVKQRLISKKTEVDRGDGWVKEHSGLMEYEPLHVERYWFTKAVHFETRDTVKLLCLVEGEEAVLFSPTDAFEPFVIHYAEAIVIPAKVGQFYIRPTTLPVDEPLAVLEVYQDLGSRY